MSHLSTVLMSPSPLTVLLPDIYSSQHPFQLCFKVSEWMDLEGIEVSEISQPEKDKYHMFSLMCGI